MELTNQLDVSVDCVVFGYDGEDLKVLLIMKMLMMQHQIKCFITQTINLYELIQAILFSVTNWS